MIDYLASFVNTDGAAFPNTYGINASAPGAGDGTEFVKLFIDDLWGARQALMAYAGLTPDGVTEAPGTSQFVDAIQESIALGVTDTKFDSITEYTAAHGVDIETVHIENGRIEVPDTTESTSKDTGCVVVEGGIGVEKTLVTGGKVLVKDTTDSTSKDTGCLIVEGGIGVEKSINLGGAIERANVPVAGFLVDGTPIYRKRVAIGAWNMDTAGTLTVNHGITGTIISALAFVRSDIATLPIYSLDRVEYTTGIAAGGIRSISDVSVFLGRVAGELFDDAAFSSVAISRGYIYIDYI